MICPNCKSNEISVKDSRDHREYNWIKRRRECHKCEFRWNTVELSEAEIAIQEE
jgi:transcriptional regulator NrdR family protein